MMYPPFFEPLFQRLRIQKVLPHMKWGGVHVDVGCDEPSVFLNEVAPKMVRCIGLDIVIKNKKIGNITYMKQDLQKRIALKDKIADTVTMMAVLEHMKYPEDIVKECYRILKKDGVLLITVPSPKNEPLLELFSKIGLVRHEMIEQHENYFTPESLQTICKKVGFSSIQVELFEFGLNTFVKAVK